MPRYLIERKFDVGEEEMPKVGKRSRQIAEEQFPGQIEWEHSHVIVDEHGRVTTLCVYSAPNEDLVRQHAQELGQHSVVAIREIAGDVTPADFPV
jgi:hypothetical protein